MEPTRNWDDRALLLLGVLMTQSGHGYQINEFIERQLCNVVTMKKPTAYALLDRLAGDGYISVHLAQEGNRPQRKVYTITEAGQALFDELLKANLSSLETPVFNDDIGLMFLKHLPQEQVIALLRQRLARLEAAIENTVDIPPHGGMLTLGIALDHIATLRRADRDWMVATIARLEQDATTAVYSESHNG
ncbi:MAG TPA: PadR family transcriptional regulator [Thermomicrobiales bacterium]|nr:PadR family transcriptional regulator [Thermomicrobiales bacterium]